MKRKGFTLVELLAVIAILAILVIIALPNVMGMFNSAKEKTFITEVQKILRGAEQAYVQDSFSTSGTRIYSKCNEGCSNELDMSIRDDLEYYIEINGQGKVIKYYARDNSYQYKYEGEELKVDEIKEVESLAEIPENQIISIDETGVDTGAQDIEVCYYNTILFCLYDEVDYIATPTENKITCSSRDTVEQCVKSHFMKNEAYLYNNPTSNPGNNLSECLINNHPSQTGITGYRNVLNNYARQCTGNESFHRSVEFTDKVLPSSQGCYSDRVIPIVECCLAGDTEIDVYDKKKKKRVKKKLKDITYDDLIVCWDFEKGEMVYAKPFWIMKPTKSNKSIDLTFSDGTKLKAVGDHRIFSFEDEEFVSCEKCNIGITTINVNNEKVTLVDRKIINEEILAYNVITKEHINMFANGILTSQGANNVYKINNMKFVKEDREHFTKEELSIVPKEYIEGLRLDLWKVYDKGSKEETLEDMKEYVNKLNKTKK